MAKGTQVANNTSPSPTPFDNILNFRDVEGHSQPILRIKVGRFPTYNESVLKTSVAYVWLFRMVMHDGRLYRSARVCCSWVVILHFHDTPC